MVAPHAHAPIGGSVLPRTEGLGRIFISTLLGTVEEFTSRLRRTAPEALRINGNSGQLRMGTPKVVDASPGIVGTQILNCNTYLRT